MNQLRRGIFQKRRLTHHGNRQLHRPTQQESKAVHLDCKSSDILEKSHALKPRSINAYLCDAAH
jgi:hypothetical protein